MASEQGIDPTINYCKRVNHQSTLKNGYIYIDGGLEVFVNWDNNGIPYGNETFGYSQSYSRQRHWPPWTAKTEPTHTDTYLLQLDMTKDWDWKGNFPIDNIAKTANEETGNPVPVVSRGALFAGGPDDNNIYLYGGTTTFENTSFPGYTVPGSPQYPLWSFDTDLQIWTLHDRYTMGPDALSIPNAGAWDSAPDQGLGFYFNGQIDSGTSSATSGLGSNSYMLTGLIILNLANQTARNLSTESIEPVTSRTRASLSYISNVGYGGAVVLLGGIAQSFQNSTDQPTGDVISLATIYLFDIANSTWYEQATTGMVPDPRMDFCIVSVSASDNSSHQIFLYGGRNDTVFFDDIYVLSLPSFTWTLLFQGYSPRAFHTCHVVGQSQMITIGGTNDTDFLRGCDWESKGVAIYNLNTGVWGSGFTFNASAYQVPANVTAVIGGGPLGNATMTAPANGFDDPRLAKLFKEARTTSGTAPPPRHGLSRGAMAGTVAATIALALALSCVFCWRRWLSYRAHPINKLQGVHTNPQWGGGRMVDGDTDLDGTILLRNLDEESKALPPPVEGVSSDEADTDMPRAQV